jgi:hypothetical protein
MAKKQRPQDTSSVETRSFQKGMVKDVNESLMPEGAYLMARNAANNSRSGDLGVIGNEQSNKFCAAAPYTVIGSIHLFGDEWAIFSTDDVESEIGRFDESLCTYTTTVNDRCLGFKKTNPILGGQSKENFDCTWQIYWADNLNPDRSMNMDKPAYIQIPDPTNLPPCKDTIDSTELDCERLRMARLTIQPCLRMEQGLNGGELLNGTYQAVIAYTENEQRVSDYSIPSNIMSMFDHRNVNGSIDIIIEDIDQTYDEFELVVMVFVNQQLVAKKIGIYSTHTKRISLDKIDATRTTVPVQLIPLDRPAYERSEGIYRNGEYLIRVAPTTRFSFNYQPLANKIKTQWVSTRYPADYYRNAGTSVGYLRDEVYSFFIRWIYDTNDKTESYHIPGRAPVGNETSIVPSPAYGTGFQFEEFNTANSTPIPGGVQVGTTQDDGGYIEAKGDMGYWESSEIYPDKNPVVWGDLCGEKIRHHKMPDSGTTGHFGSGGVVNVLGVEFSNIPYPVDNQNVPIPGIAGYEILRGSREGNKTIVAKGLLNNMGAYNREDGGGTAYYQNYPYNDLRPDPFLNVTDFISGDKNNGGGQHAGFDAFQDKKFTFHSPDTQFKHPFLSAKELKLYQNHAGFVEGAFNEPYKHPEHKLMTDMSFILAGLVGFGLAIKAMQGVRRSTRGTPSLNSNHMPHTDWTTTVAGGGTALGTGINYAQDQLSQLGTTLANIPNQVLSGIAEISYQTGADSLLMLSTGAVGEGGVAGGLTSQVQSSASTTTGMTASGGYEFSSEGETGMPGTLAIFQAIPTFLAYWSEGTQTFIDLIQAFSRSHQYALAYESHCFYDSAASYTTNSNRFPIDDASYIGDRLQEFGGITLNNLYRSSCVGLTTGGPAGVPRPQDIGGQTDNSRRTFRTAFNDVVSKDNVGRQVAKTSSASYGGGIASSHYVGLKQRLRNQYGQVDGIMQVPTSSCMQVWKTDSVSPPNATSDVIFGGDTYIGRYTEKNSFFYFSDWMLDLPDEFEYDYRLRKMMPFPTFWMDTHDFQVNDFIKDIFDMIFGGGNNNSGTLPTSWHNLDTKGNHSASTLFPQLGNPVATMTGMKLIIKDAYMYLFNSGVRDFIVESETNIEYRDWGDDEEQRHYDPRLYVDLVNMFRSDRIKAGNFFKYDYSLQASRYYQGFPNWGTTQYRNYDPFTAEECYSYYPNRVIYSLPQNKELRYDNWLLYLVNNYKDFTSRVTTIKPIGKNGAMMLFENEAPAIIPGVDTLQTDSGTKITIGDGGLFSQPLQNLVNADSSYEYGSCQDRLSVVNTPAGLFWVSQNQGKIFNYSNNLTDISQEGMKWWFEEFLPYKIIEDFPNFELTDNTVIGVGCQSIYDNSNGIVYFTKRDFKLSPEWIGRVEYVNEDNFIVEGGGRIKLGDPRYFDNASWTVSYDPKAKAWISFHDWHPNFLLPSKNNFMTVANKGIWKHNNRSNSYCNYYGIDFPFEVELTTPTGQSVNTLKSLEYQMEVFQWADNEVDRNHVLDFNFDKAVVYNTEQMSGELRLNLTPKNNPQAMLNYPQVNPNSIDILYDKVEQKYRFNQFWDITDDRGEFTNARRMMWLTQPNGYTKEINPQYVNYNKAPTQRKKFRHYVSGLWLRRMRSGPHNMQLKLVNTKNQYSPR